MKVGFISLGCPKNLVDSEVMLGLTEQAGHELTREATQAEVLVVNTCAFIDSARQESIDAILEMAQHKRTGACTRLVVTGCLAERYREELRAQIPEIDEVLGTGEVPDIVAAIDGRAARHVLPVTFHRRPPGDRQATEAQRKQSALNDHEPSVSSLARWPDSAARMSPTYIYDADTPRTLATPGHFAYVKVAEGCDYKCAFCIIPTLRGRYRSRPADSIVREARALAARGVRELILISQDTTFYGVDRGERGALARLLRRLDGIEGIAWIRLLYLYPTTIDAETIETMAECDKVCKYVDLPLQHASDRVLARMRRPGTRKSYERLLHDIRDRIPGVTLRTTFIVGFPGETEADFEELCDFVDETAFDHVGVFTYSHEEGTPAYALPNDVPGAVKRRRRGRLMEMQKRSVRRAQKRRIGQVARLLVDGPAPEHALVVRGRLEGQAPDIDPCVYLTECDPSHYRAGDLVRVEVVGARDYDLVARPLS